MPLGLRHSVWPPKCVIRPTSWYKRFSRGSKHFSLALIELCARELLRILRVPVTVRPYNKSRPLNLTFFSSMNFVVSRRRIQLYTHPAWRTLADRFVNVNLCLPETQKGKNATSLLTSLGGDDDASKEVVDQHRLGKYTLGMTTEFLQQTIFNLVPLEDGPAPAVPLDGEHCMSPAAASCHPE